MHSSIVAQSHMVQCDSCEVNKWFESQSSYTQSFQCYVSIQKSASSRAFDIHSAILVLADDAPVQSVSSQSDVAFCEDPGCFVSSSLMFKIFWQYDKSNVRRPRACAEFIAGSWRKRCAIQDPAEDDHSMF